MKTINSKASGFIQDLAPKQEQQVVELPSPLNVEYERVKSLEAMCVALTAESAVKSRCLDFFASVIKSGEEWTSVCQLKYDSAREHPSTDAYMAEVRSEVIEWMDAEITAIDTMYRGDPCYEHDAHWMKTEVLSVVDLARKAFARGLAQ